MTRHPAMPDDVAIIVNRNAGSMRRDPSLAEQLRAAVSGAACVHVTADLAELQQLCGQLAADGVRTVGVVGGDSTASTTLTALWRAYPEGALPRIGLLRGGTMNTVASSLGISRRAPKLLLAELIESARRKGRPRSRRRPLMLVADRLGFLFGTGVWYGYLAETYQHGPPTFAVNVKVLCRVFASAATNGPTIRRVTRPTELEVRFSHSVWETRPYLSVAAGTVPDVGFGFQPFHRALDADSGFQILAIDGSARDLLRELPRLQRGEGFASTTARQAITTWAELHAREGRIEYSVDGDIDAIEGPLRISLGPAFEFLLL